MRHDKEDREGDDKERSALARRRAVPTADAAPYPEPIDAARAWANQLGHVPTAPFHFVAQLAVVPTQGGEGERGARARGASK